ncbi:unnamed protein product [Peniophora sp. CBMAI 1063]|nr:unnamed protein product [Peniophora sp. CBMAI 1063]
MEDSEIAELAEQTASMMRRVFADDMIETAVAALRSQGMYRPENLYKTTVELVTTESHLATLRKLWTTLDDRFPKDESEHIKCEFSAKYLPTLADKRRDPTVNRITAQAISVSIGRAFETEIFPLFLLSSSARGLVAQQIRLMVDFPIGVQRGDVGLMSRTLILLLLGQGCDEVDLKLKRAIIRLLERWVKEYKGHPAAENCASCLWVMTGSREPQPDLITDVKEVLAFRANSRGCWQCHVVRKPLLKCARCKYALYCCQEHQKKDWKLHKPWCFSSNF